MRRLLKILATLLALAAVAACVQVASRTRAEAHRLLTNPIETRRLPNQNPSDYGMVYDEVSVVTTDGLKLAGWYIPTKNGAVVIAQHGYKSSRGEMLNEAAMLHGHGYGVLITSIRAHDMSDGDLITFGHREMRDLDAWFRFVASREEVDTQRIGMLGNSLGGSLAIEYAATQPDVRAVVANSAFSSLSDTIATSVRYYTGLPAFPFAPMIAFWAEREAGFRRADVDAKRWIGRISPRPVLLMQGGDDVVISPESGQLLYDAASEPKELWYEPRIGHSRFDTVLPQEYERRVAGFFDRYLFSR